MNTDEISESDCGWMGLTRLNKVELRAIYSSKKDLELS